MLGELLVRRIEIEWKNGKKLNVRELSVLDWQEMVEIEKLEDATELMDRQLNFVARCLSRNTEQVKVTAEELSKVNMAYVKAVYNVLLMRTSLTVTDPN